MMKKLILFSILILGSIDVYSQLHTYVGLGSVNSRTSTVNETNPQYRVTAYYNTGSSLEKQTIKIEIAENDLGQDEIYVIAYYDNYTRRWNELSYKKTVSQVNKLYASTYEEENFDYMVFLGNKYVYFNI